MSFNLNWLNPLHVATGVGLLAIAATVGFIYSSDRIPNPLETCSKNEVITLHRVERYCFGSLPWEKDGPTCQLWLSKYRDLGTYGESDEDPVTATINQQVTDAARQHIVDTLGVPEKGKPSYE